MDILQRRKFCREFLNGYNEKLHPQIISKVFEIGLITLKKRYNKLLFSKDELDEIIKDLNGKEYVEIVPLPPLKKNETIPIPPQKCPPPQKIEEYNFNIENRDTCPFQNTIFRNHQMYEKTLQNPNFITQNSAIYPNWWWNNKEEEYEKPKNNINVIYNEDYNDGYNNYNDNNNNNNEGENINDDYEGGEDENNYQNYQEVPEIENTEMKNKNYTIKKLTMNSSKPKKMNKSESNKEVIYYEKRKIIPHNNKNGKTKSNNIKKINNNQRVKSSRQTNRKINSFNNNNNNNNKVAMQKLIKKVDNRSKDRRNVQLTKIPKYRYTYVNGKILRVPEETFNNYHNLTMTEPNKY